MIENTYYILVHANSIVHACKSPAGGGGEMRGRSSFVPSLPTDPDARILFKATTTHLTLISDQSTCSFFFLISCSQRLSRSNSHSTLAVQQNTYSIYVREIRPLELPSTSTLPYTYVQYHDINLATAKMYEILGPIFLAFPYNKNVLLPNRWI